MMTRAYPALAGFVVGVFALAVFVLSAGVARATNLQLGVSVDVIPISSSFDGMNIIVFGTIENHDAKKLEDGLYSVIVEVTGPHEEVTVRRKQRVFGIWINRHSRSFANVPSMYFVASDGELDKKVPVSELDRHDLGIRHLNLSLVSRGKNTFILPAPKYSQALRNLMQQRGLFGQSSQALQYLSPSLFRVSVPLPANVPLGEHTVKAYLFEDGKKIATNTTQFRVSKIGFEQWIYNLAHTKSLLYGIMAVMLALATGWLANIVLRRD